MTEQAPAVSVVIPTYNCSGPLRLTLETVLMQEFADFEVWVVGDGCTDESEAVVASFGDDRLNWVGLPTNSGTPAVPRNEGLKRACGRYIAYLGHDDLWFPWHLAGLVDRIAETGGDFAYSIGLLLAPDGVAGPFTLPDEAWDRERGLSPSSWLHTRELLDAVGPWSAVLQMGDDRDFLRRVLEADLRLEPVLQLGVLKFPAMMWSMYSIESDFPQTPYVEAMRQDARGLEDELLLQFAASASKQKTWWSSRRDGYPDFLQSFARWAVTVYGHDRWPVDRLLRRRWRRRAGLTGGSG